ncbi:hypothetical protein GCK72_004673 [Caenorhabditis remanei]|uniref:F-box domain-containing protein n=1 Tax=Caenorhabditis remanei TaxID=31234 RepID=A0A6A5HEB1_CAERE|nr:hypothetical protein GCK72_004673 [Caenorhabditis remanei]KAF1764723.1 hypothetical protein GCK72_004673 [Caenorhabditis remanei]
MNPVGKEKPFRLFRLPFLAINVVIQNMKIQEILKLALSSRRAEMVVRLGNHKLKSFKVRMEKTWHDPKITMTRFDDDFCDVKLRRYSRKTIRQDEVVPKRYMFELSGNLSIQTTGSWKEVVIASDYFRSLFKIPKYWFSYVLILKELSDNNIIEILSCLNWEKSGQLVMYQGRIEKEVMQYLLDTLPSDVCLRIYSMIDYEMNHEKALSFPHIIYNEAHWITLDNLKSMRNCKDVKLNRTNFTCEDIRKLIDYWTDCEEDMFRRLTIRLKDNVTHDMDTIIQTMVVLKYGYSENGYIFYTAKKRLLGTIKLEEGNKIILTSFKRIGRYKAIPPILELCERRKELFAELKNVYDEIVKFTKEWNEGVYEMKSEEETNNKLDEYKNNQIHQ